MNVISPCTSDQLESAIREAFMTIAGDVTNHERTKDGPS